MLKPTKYILNIFGVLFLFSLLFCFKKCLFQMRNGACREEGKFLFSGNLCSYTGNKIAKKKE